MKSDKSFLAPNNYVCFSVALVSGLAFYGLLFFGDQYISLSLKRMLGPIEKDSSSMFIYVFLYVLFFWGIIIILAKNFLLNAEINTMKTLEQSFESSRIINERAELDELRNKINHGPGSHKIRHCALGKILLFLIDHCLITETSSRVMEIFSRRMETLERHVESSYSMLRYVAWAIPSLGFIGTVMGIGSALSLVDLAMEDMSLVTQPLGLAFDTTLIALTESIILMFFLHTTQNKEEELLNTIDLFCQEKFIINLRLG